MRFLTAEVLNFGSYKELSFDFDANGLTLIHGATGSGKSTLQDIIPWILFGVTAKDGSVDDIRNWNSLDLPTTGVLIVEKPMETLIISRIRGKGKNDLYFYKDGEPDKLIRGKDITETQTLLEGRLGISSESYIAGAYYNEFSPVGAFFTAKASDRRELLEKLSDLSLPKKLQERAADERKRSKKAELSISSRLDKALGRLEQLKSQAASNQGLIRRWEEDQARSIKELEEKSQNFNQEIQHRIELEWHKQDLFEKTRTEAISRIQDKIDTLRYRLEVFSKLCDYCGQPNEQYQEVKDSLGKAETHLQSLVSAICPNVQAIATLTAATNVHEVLLNEKRTLSNPFVLQNHTIVLQNHTTEIEVINLREELRQNQTRTHALEQLSALAYELRGHLLQTAVYQAETQTNTYLEKYFDAEIRVVFELHDDDNIHVEVYKNGHSCTYRQLSKGQRQMLKLSFAVAVMDAVSDNAGTHFNTLFFDEALDGLDTELKLKAFNLLTELSTTHESVFVIDHSDTLKTCFSNSYHVTLENDESRVKHD